MQAACSLHAACCILHAACCNLQPPAYDRMQAACRLHAACMQPACISSVALALVALYTDFLLLDGEFSNSTNLNILASIFTEVVLAKKMQQNIFE